jgi:hypothetical protein
MCKVSQRKTQYLIDDGHRIEFTAGQDVAVHCLTLGCCLLLKIEA